MKIRKITAMTAVLVLVVVTLGGCTTFDNFKEAFIDDPKDTTNTINIGVYEPMSGADKDAAAPEIQGIELAHKMHPQVDGKKVNLIYADNNSDIDAAETAISSLMSKNPSVILGSYGNIYSLIASEGTDNYEGLEKYEIPAITMTNTNPLITRNNSYYFRICYIDATQGRLLSNYLDSIDIENAGILLPEKDDAAMAMATAFRNSFEELTNHSDAISYYENYTMGDKDFSKQLENLRQSGVKYVLLPGEITDALNIIKQASTMQLDVTFLGGMSWSTDDFKKELPAYVDPKHVAFVQFFATDGDDKLDVVSESRQQFLDAYYREYGKSTEPEDSVALGYDAYMIALDAIEKATAGSDKTADGKAIRDMLLSDGYRFEGASGTIEFNKSGDPKKTAYICTFDNDAVKAIYTIEANQQ